MKNSFSTILRAAMAVAVSVTIAVSCQKEETMTQPTVTITPVSAGMTEATVNISATDASAIAYYTPGSLSSLNSAKAILAGGIPVEVPGEDVVLTNLTPGSTYYVAAAAMSEDGIYSEVATLEINTTGTDCSFTITITNTTSGSITYSVVPSDNGTGYYVGAVEKASLPENPDEAAIHQAVIANATSSAEAAGIGLSEYLSANMKTGEQTGNLTGLKPATGYIVAAMGLSTADGSLTTPVSTEEATTMEETASLTFELSATEITTSTAHVKVVPSDMNAKYVWLCQPAGSYPGLSEDEPNAIADTYVENQRHFLDAGMGLYTGAYDIPDFAVNQNTRYYLFAFGYEPGVGRSGECFLLAFDTERGILPEDFTAEISVDAVTARRMNYRVIPEQGSESIYYYSMVIPAENYSDEFVKDSTSRAIKMQYDFNVQYNPGYTMTDATESTCERGEHTFEPGGLTPETDYIVAAVAVSNDGVPTDKIVTAEARTSSETASGAYFDNTYIGVYDGNEALAAGLFPESTTLKDAAVAVFEVERNDEAVECYYYLANGDYSDPEEEYRTDDDLLSWITTNPFFYLVEEGTTHLFIKVNYYDIPPYGGMYTLLSVAKDASGQWGTIDRTYFNPISTETDPIEDLVDLVNSLN